MVLCSCVVENADSPRYSEKGLQNFASEVAEEKFIYPLALFETVLLIDDYEKLEAEEKVGLKHIFGSLIKVSDNVYTMEKFFNLKVSTDGRSVNEAGAEWFFQTEYSMFGYDTRSFTLYNSPENENCDFLLHADVKEHGGVMYIDKVDDETYFSWKIEMEGTLESFSGLTVRFRTDGPVTRKVERATEANDKSMVTMDGRLVVTIFGADGKELDEIRYDLPETEVNQYYQF